MKVGRRPTLEAKLAGYGAEIERKLELQDGDRVAVIGGGPAGPLEGERDSRS